MRTNPFSIKEQNNDAYLELAARKKRLANQLALNQFNKPTIAEQREITPKKILEIAKLEIKL